MKRPTTAFIIRIVFIVDRFRSLDDLFQDSEPVNFVLWSKIKRLIDWLIVLGFNDMSNLMGHFVSSPPRERGKRDRRVSSGDERERLGRKRIRNQIGETEEIKNISLYTYLLQR